MARSAVSLLLRSDDIEKALQELLGAAAGPSGIVITVRRHDEYEELLFQIQDLQKKLEDSQRQIVSMSQYANLYLLALDDVRDCVKLLRSLDVDCSFIRSFKRK